MQVKCFTQSRQPTMWPTSIRAGPTNTEQTSSHNPGKAEHPTPINGAQGGIEHPRWAWRGEFTQPTLCSSPMA